MPEVPDGPRTTAPEKRGPGLVSLRRAAAALCIISIAWTFLVLVAGGFRWRVGPFRVSSANPLPPLALAIVSGAAAWALSTPVERRRTAQTMGRWTRGERGVFRWASERETLVAPAAAAMATAAIVAFGLLKGSFVASGADEYGYLSQVELWNHGSLIVEQPFGADMTWSDAGSTLTPLGYRPYWQVHGADIVPIYSPGLPIVMAAFKRLGGPAAIFLVVPLLGGLAVWCTYLIGSRFADRFTGVCAAILVAASPALLFEVVAPTSDAPTTFWWALSLALLLARGAGAAFAAGLAAGMAVLTRPNLAPILVVPSLFLVWQTMKRDEAMRMGDRLSIRRLLCFVAGAMPACVFIAILNRELYGSPLASGYGTLENLYQLRYFGTNLVNYSRWIFEAETPIVLLAFCAPFAVGRAALKDDSASTERSWAVLLLAFAAAVVVAYLFYIPFDHAGYLRFMLPAFPPLIVLTIVTLAAILRRSVGTASRFVSAVIVAIVAWHGLDSAIGRGLLGWRSEERYETVGHYVAQKLPARAAFLSMQHSGSLRYYTGRLTVRYDLIAPAELDTVVNELRKLGYHPYFVLDNVEQDAFRDRFRASPLGALDWIPVVIVHEDSVRIYDPADREAGRGLQRAPDVLP